MSVKWTGNHNETGILRKSERKEKKEELFVFGYSCKLFRDNDKALHIDQGKHLIPWMGDETLKIDRYDARGALHDLSALEAPSGGYDWRVELTRAEREVEQLCDEERYRALHTDEDEEEMYKEEELKRLHAAGYGQVGFNYDAPAEPSTPEAPAEIEEPFEPSQVLKDLLPTNTVFPDTQKQNAIIEKTANFIAHQGAQMEILIKAKQRDNSQFQFLNKECPLHGYYTALTALVKAGKWPEKKIEVVEEKPQDMNEEYLHPSLASTIIESAPSIPSIHYKPSADCDYTLLISKMRGDATLDEAYTTELAPGEVAPPGTEPLPPRTSAEISRAPVMYNRDQAANTAVQQQQFAAFHQQYMPLQETTPANTPPISNPPPQMDKKPTVTKSTGLSLMKNYNTDSDSDVSDFDDSSSSDSKDKPIVLTPPDDVKTVIDKMAAYVARNGDEFEEIVRSKNDPRFTFLEPDNLYHPFYKRLMQEKRGVDVNGKDNGQTRSDKTPVVSFSIKKLKEPDPILPKPALPYESSSDDEDGNKQADTNEEAKEPPKSNIPQIQSSNSVPPVLVYKMEAGQINNLPVVKTIEQRVSNKTARAITVPDVKQQEKESIKEQVKPEEITDKQEERKPEKSPERKEEKNRYREKRSPSNRKHHERKKEYRSKEHRERRSERRSVDREKKRDRESEKKRKKYKDDLESEIISLEDNSDDMIDLTGDQSDSKGEGETEADKSKQQERRRRAAEFLKRVGVDPAAAALPATSLASAMVRVKGEGETEADKSKQQERRRRAAEFLKRVGVDPAAAALPATSLASAMVDTLESLRKKKQEQEEKRRRHEKRRRKEKREYEIESEKHRKNKRKKNRSSDDEESDYESSKKKKRKKDKKPSKNKKRKRHEIESEEEPPPRINIDLTNTLKELRSMSPTKQLEMDRDPPAVAQESSSEEDSGKKKKKKDREYSEGEWSSDTDEDSVSSGDRE